MGITPDVPPPRDPSKELRRTAQAYLRTAPQFYNLEAQYGPLYGQLNLQELQQQQQGYIDAQGQYHPGTQALQSQQRGADVGDVMRYGPAATLAILQANPYLAAALNQMGGRLQDSPVLSTLNQQALGGLQSGGRLSPQEQRDIQQQSRAAFSARGQALGDPAIASEILNRDAAVRQRAAAAQQFATGVEGLNQAQGQNIQRSAGIFSGTLSDPFQAILGRPSNNQVMPVNQLFNPTNPYFSDIYNTNYNAQAAANIAGANNQAALYSAIISSIGQAAGAAAGASDRRVKKDIKRIGKSPSGLGIYSFRYKGKRGGQKFIGPMAQDVERRRPDAVSVDPFSRVKMVHFDRIDVPFRFAGVAA